MPPLGRTRRVPVYALAVLAAAATWMATRHGPALSADSATYFSAANRIGAGLGYTDFTGGANTTFPPAFSTLLAVLGSLGLSLATAARVANAAFFTGVVGLTWVVAARHTRSSFARLGATAAVAVSPAMLDLADHAWSEPAFCVLVLLFVLVLEDSVTRDRARTRSAATAGMIVGAAFLVRYAGAILIPVGVVVLAIALRSAGRRIVVTRVSVFLACALVLPSLWILRNASTAAPYVLGPRTVVADGVDELARLFVVSFGSLFIPSRWTHDGLVIAVPFVLLAAAVSTLPAEHATAGEMDGHCCRSHRSSSSIRCSSSGRESCRVRASTGASWRRSIHRPSSSLPRPSRKRCVESREPAGLRSSVRPGCCWSVRRSPPSPDPRSCSCGRSKRMVRQRAAMPPPPIAFRRWLGRFGPFVPASSSPRTGRGLCTSRRTTSRSSRPRTALSVGQPRARDQGHPRRPVVRGRVYVAWYGSTSTPPSDRVGGLRLRKLRAVTDGTLYQVEPTDPGCTRTARRRRRPIACTACSGGSVARVVPCACACD